MKWISVTRGLVPALLVPMAAQAQPFSGPHYGHMWDGGWHGMFFGPMMMMVFLAVIVVIVVLALRWLGAARHGGVPHRPRDKTPLDILKERFARGEIDEAEYQSRRRVLDE